MEELVQQSISTLPEPQRVVLVLRDVEGLEYEQIAEMMDLNIGTVKSRLHNALKTLCRVASNREQPGPDRGISTEARSMLVRTQKRLLHGILRSRGIAHRLGEAKDRRCVPLDELLERAAVSFGRAGDQLLVCD